MTDSSLKLVLFLVAVGLIGALLVVGLYDAFGSAVVSMAEVFSERVAACKAEHPGWAREECEGVVRGDVWTGMTAEMLVASLGEPYDVDPSDLDPTREVWTYRTSTYGEELFRLADGLLESWEQAPGCKSCSPKPLRK
jgi:hypothetical protein